MSKVNTLKIMKKFKRSDTKVGLPSLDNVLSINAKIDINIPKANISGVDINVDVNEPKIWAPQFPKTYIHGNLPSIIDANANININPPKIDIHSVEIYRPDIDINFQKIEGHKLAYHYLSQKLMEI